MHEARDVTLQFRASATLANVQAVATQYDEAFAQLGRLLTLLPQVTDNDARQQGLLVIGYLYNQVGEYDLAPELRGPDRRRGHLCARSLPQQSVAARSALSRRQAQGRRDAVHRCHRHLRRSRRSVVGERDPRLPRAVLHRPGPHPRRDQAAEQLLRRDARHALPPADFRIRFVAGARLQEHRRLRDGAPVRAARDRQRSRHPEPVHRAAGELVPPAVPGRAGTGRRRRPRSPITRNTPLPTRVTSTTSARARSLTSARNTRRPRTGCRSTRSTSRTRFCSCSRRSARKQWKPVACTSRC